MKTLAQLLNEPIPSILAAVNGRIVEMDLDAEDRSKFVGSYYRLRSGAVAFAMPSGQDPAVRDATIRGLLANVLGLDSTDWSPAHFTDITAAVTV